MPVDLEEEQEQEMLEIPELPEDLQRELFRLAHEVREREPWKRFLDHDWFGIVSPETGEVQIVSIMGADRQLFAVQLYLPEEGIRFWNHIIETNEVDEGMLMYDRRMVECEFCDSDQIADEHLELNERFPPRGKRKRDHGYVSVRGYRPGHYPWFAEEHEARAMVTALRLVEPFERHMTKCCDQYGFNFDAQAVLIPIFGLREGGDPANADDWAIERGPFPEALPPVLPEAPADEVFHERMRALKVKRGTRWETGGQFLPVPVPDGGRLVFPTALLTVAHEWEELPAPLVGTPNDSRAGLMRKSFAQTAEARGYLPEVLLVSSCTAEVALADLAERSGMRIERVEDLPVLDEVLERLSEQMQLAARHGVEAAFEEFEGEDASGRAGPPREFSGMRYVMRVDLKGAKPPIWRRFSLPIEATFAELHFAIQDAMGWDDAHLHEFKIQNGLDTVMRIEPDQVLGEAVAGAGGVEVRSEWTTTVQEVVERGFKKIAYLYDFGDHWDHNIRIEKAVEGAPADLAGELLAGRGACPPEDCGGLGGFYALLDGNHPFVEEWDEEDLAKYRDPKFDPIMERD